MSTTPTNTTLPQLQQARKDFLELVAALRPDLHRYCSRMVGSVIDGEDVVQETLARGYYELSALQNPPALRSWLFRIAHNRALDYLRLRRPSEPLENQEEATDIESDPGNLLPREQAVTLAMARFLELAPSQRSCVILKDVLDYSLEEIALSLDLTLPAVKAALHRGRTRLKSLVMQPEATLVDVSPTVHRYASLFNDRNWDAVRDLLIDDVRLEVVDATSRRGRKEVGVYFTNYAGRTGWRVIPARLDGREGLLVLPSGNFVELTVQGERIAQIRDFHHVPYLTAESQPKVTGS
ncbi:MAG: sigma-70 family RNA polymerase sigma factor [Proteobacteria bacterium]|nr:sigma-70 family RNA polymerase sigma factor [Pseudomonadota bacterium]